MKIQVNLQRNFQWKKNQSSKQTYNYVGTNIAALDFYNKVLIIW